MAMRANAGGWGMNTKTLYAVVILFAFVIGITNFINSFIINSNGEESLVLSDASAMDKISRLEKEIALLNHKNNQLGNLKQRAEAPPPPVIVNRESSVSVHYDRANERAYFEEMRKNQKDFGLPKRPLYPAEWVSEVERIRSESKSCLHTINRDYTKNPVEHVSRGSGHLECPIGCVRGTADIGGYGGGECPHRKTYEATMENTGRSRGTPTHMAGNTRLHSDVVMQYFSWAEYDFMEPPKPKRQDAPVAAFISNCGPQYRLQYLAELIENGVEVHSYGKCSNNKQIPKSGDNHSIKKQMIAEYKFTLSFENSETDDYITEKLFQPLASGSVPIYYGAPNARKFAPSNHSVIWAEDFKSVKEMAAYIKKLDKDDKLYNEYHRWKTEGPSKEWVALVDMAILHSECRFCVRSADIDRLTVGEPVTGPYENENMNEMVKWKDTDALMLKVRERGTFWLRRIHLVEYTVSELRRKVFEKWNDPSKGDIIWMWELWDPFHDVIDTDEKIRRLQYGHEIEVVFENPGSWERGSYSQWWHKKYQNDNDDH